MSITERQLAERLKKIALRENKKVQPVIDLIGNKVRITSGGKQTNVPLFNNLTQRSTTSVNR